MRYPPRFLCNARTVVLYSLGRSLYASYLMTSYNHERNDGMHRPCLRHAALTGLLVVTFALPVWGQALDTMETMDKATAEQVFKKPGYSPYAGRNFPTRPLFGDTHLHTSVSFDAIAFGNRLGPEEAYRFARGEEVVSSTGVPAKLSRPLDFLVVADHAESLGVMGDVLGGNPLLMADPTVRRWHEMLRKGGEEAMKVYYEMGPPRAGKASRCLRSSAMPNSSAPSGSGKPRGRRSARQRRPRRSCGGVREARRSAFDRRRRERQDDVERLAAVGDLPVHAPRRHVHGKAGLEMDRWLALDVHRARAAQDVVRLLVVVRVAADLVPRLHQAERHAELRRAHGLGMHQPPDRGSERLEEASFLLTDREWAALAHRDPPCRWPSVEDTRGDLSGDRHPARRDHEQRHGADAASTRYAVPFPSTSPNPPPAIDPIAPAGAQAKLKSANARPYSSPCASAASVSSAPPGTQNAL